VYFGSRIHQTPQVRQLFIRQKGFVPVWYAHYWFRWKAW